MFFPRSYKQQFLDDYLLKGTYEKEDFISNNLEFCLKSINNSLSTYTSFIKDIQNVLNKLDKINTNIEYFYKFFEFCSFDDNDQFLDKIDLNELKIFYKKQNFKSNYLNYYFYKKFNVSLLDFKKNIDFFNDINFLKKIFSAYDDRIDNPLIRQNFYYLFNLLSNKDKQKLLKTSFWQGFQVIERINNNCQTYTDSLNNALIFDCLQNNIKPDNKKFNNFTSFANIKFFDNLDNFILCNQEYLKDIFLNVNYNNFIFDFYESNILNKKYNEIFVLIKFLIKNQVIDYEKFINENLIFYFYLFKDKVNHVFIDHEPKNTQTKEYSNYLFLFNLIYELEIEGIKLSCDCKLQILNNIVDLICFNKNICDELIEKQIACLKINKFNNNLIKKKELLKTILNNQKSDLFYQNLVYLIDLNLAKNIKNLMIDNILDKNQSFISLFEKHQIEQNIDTNNALTTKVKNIIKI